MARWGRRFRLPNFCHRLLCYDRTANEPVPSEQLYIALGVPLVVNAAFTALILAYMNSRVSEVKTQISGLQTQISGLDRRIDEMKDIWRSELFRVEQVLDARLKHLEEHSH